MFLRRSKLLLPVVPLVLIGSKSYCSSFDSKGVSTIVSQSPDFQGKFRDIPLHLQAVGMRRKNLWLVEVDVYMAGLSLSKTAEASARHWRQHEVDTRTLADVLTSVSEAGSLSGTAKALVSLRFVRTVTTSQVVEAFNESFQGIDPSEVNQFKHALNESIGLNGMKNGEEVGFYWMNAGGLCITINGEIRQRVRSPLVEARLLQVYLDPKYAVSPDLVKSFMENLAN